MHKSKKAIEYNLRVFINNEMTEEERERLIDFLPKDIREDFEEWLQHGS
jgi:hypothetical protein